MITFEIPFNNKIFKEQMALSFKQAWKKSVNANYRRLFWIIPTPIFGIILLMNGSYVGIVFIFTGFHFLIKFFEFIMQYNRYKDKFWKKVEIEEKDRSMKTNQQYGNLKKNISGL